MSRNASMHCWKMTYCRLSMKMIQSASMKSVGDNDTLAAYVATMLRADLTVILTKVDGMLYCKAGEAER